MERITQTLPSLIGGVSQQTPLARDPSQLEGLTNGWATIIDGVGKRPPTEHVAKLIANAGTNAFIHSINRDLTEQYIVLAMTDDAGPRLRVYDAKTGAEQIVYADSWNYISGIDFSTNLSMTSAGDYTFVVNKTRTVEMKPVGADLTPDPNNYVWINQGYGGNKAPGGPYQYPANPTTNFVGDIQRFDKLPETAAENSVYRIKGDPDTSFVSYYVRRSNGTWDENGAIPPNLKNAIDSETMPHALVRQPNGSFLFGPFSWANRTCGDDDNNPAPSFVGREIADVFFYSNRLCFIAGEYVTMSCVGEFGNFWRTTQTTLLDSDVLDISPSDTKVSDLKAVVGFSDGIMVSSDQSQFSLSNGETGLSVSSVAMRKVTSYSLNPRPGMTPCGSEVYFATERNGFASIIEYSRLNGADSTSGADVTSHVPTLIPAGVSRIIAADDLSTLFVTTDGAPNKVFVYNFRWSGTEKIISSWYSWDFASPVLSLTYLQGSLYGVFKRYDGVYLERLNLQFEAKPTGTDHQVYVDRQVAITGTYIPAVDKTQFELPYVPGTQSNMRVVRSGLFSDRPESLVDPTSYEWIGQNVVRVPGDLSSAPCVIGKRYAMEMELSQVVRRDSQGNAVSSGKLVLMWMQIEYQNAAYFRTLVSSYGDDVWSEQEVLPAYFAQFAGKVIGSNALILNKPAYHTGVYQFSAQGDARNVKIKIINDSHVGSNFLTATWSGKYYRR